MEDKPLPPSPDFAVFQNSRTHQSAIWTKELGRWHVCSEREYAAILVVVTLLRNSPNPTETMEQISSMLDLEG
tara:strand:+ start:373 stop:591 length:219 start_codon:yes stop_codon:yes gene_type:complete